MGLEATSWNWLRSGLKKHATGPIILERVENGVLAGMADVNFVIDGVEGWIELKSVPLPKRRDTRVLGDKGLNIDQVNWHLERSKAGCQTWVFISSTPWRWLVDGGFAKKINNYNADQLFEICNCGRKGGWDRWDWVTLMEELGRV